MLQDIRSLTSPNLHSCVSHQRPSPHPSLYIGDFNYKHVNRGCNKTSPHGKSLDSWATSINLGLLYDPKETVGFFSHWWDVGTNPYLAFASFGQDTRLPDRCVLESSRGHNIGPLSQHQQDSRFLPTVIREVLELSQGWLEALLPSRRWIRQEIAASGHTKHWEGIPGFSR